MEYPYFKGLEADRYSFYRVPKALVKADLFQKMSGDAKLLYAVLLDRMSLSIRNGWQDNHGNAYIICTIEEVMDSIHCARQKAVKLLDELEQEFRLIERRRQGLGKPNLLYVKDLYAGLSQSNYWKYENHTSGSLKNELPGVLKSNGSNTEKINKTDNSETDLIYPAELQEEEQYRRYFKEALELEILEQGYPTDKAVLYEILELLVETVTSRKKFLRICGEEKPREVVKSRLMKLDSSHIQYILECLKENSTQIRNIKQYLLATLYNAPVTVDSYYSAQVRHTYFDNGFTGTNFKRPAFTRLMNDVRQKKIKCIVVKDLSRFGRNYLEAGYYIETVFPFLGVRLIAVTDNFDSTRKEDMESLVLPIRNMVNAMYAKDISKKIWTSLQRKKEAGYAVGNDAPYGYIRNPVTKRNEIEPEAAFYVQLIFQWELMGVPIFEIARRMTLLQVPTPREWHRKMVEGKEVLTCKKWGVTTIRHILENQTYVGDTINNKSTQKLFAGQDKCDLPKEQWYVAKSTHPAIIAGDDFEKVQKILNKNRAVFQTVRAKSEQIRAEYQNDLAGMVFCADCGRPMEFERLPHGAEESKKVCYYICKARQADDKCIGHQIPEKLLKALIMDQLHLFIVQLSDKRKVLEELQKIEDVQNPVYRAKGEIMSLTDKVSQMAKKREQLYADYVAGVVDSEDYQLIREDYSRQYDGLRAALQEAENKKVQVEQQIEEYLDMTAHLEEHLDNFEFDIQLVKSLVQKIEVSADKRLRIVFRFQDVFTELGKESAET